MPVDPKAFARFAASRRERPASETSGIDYAALMRRRYEEATPEERARIDAWDAREAVVAATRVKVSAVFERESVGVSDGRRVVEKTWTKDVTLQIEELEDREIVRVVGAVTGYEAYALTPEFCAMLEDPEELAARPRFYVCAGTPGRYDACSLDTADVAAYLRERRPELFDVVAPAP